MRGVERGGIVLGEGRGLWGVYEMEGGVCMGVQGLGEREGRVVFGMVGCCVRVSEGGVG